MKTLLLATALLLVFQAPTSAQSPTSILSERDIASINRGMRESEAKENKRQEQLQKSGVLTEAAGGTPSYVVKSVPQYSSSSSKSKVGPAASRPQQPALLPETTSVGPQVGSVQRNEQESAKREQQYQNEKHLVHTDQGWDRKTNAQIAADENRERTEAAAAAAIAKTVSEKCYVVAAGGGVGTLICNP